MGSENKIDRRTFLKSSAGAAAGLAVFGQLGFSRKSFAQAKDSVKIGIVLPLTGPFSTEAQYMVEGATVAMEEFNAKGGVLGRKVELVIRDDKLKPDEAARRTKELLEKGDISFLCGGLGAHVQVAINSQAKEGKTIFMCIGSGNEINQWPDVSPYTFHEALNPYISSHTVAPWVTKNLGKKWFFLVADYSFGWQVTEALRKIGKDLGLIDAGEIKHPVGATDYFPYFPKILAAEPEVLMMDNFGKDQLNSIKQAHAFGLKRKMKIVVPVLAVSARLGAGDEAFEGVYGGASFWWTLENTIPTAKKFVSAYRQKWGRPPTDYAGYGYGGIMELMNAVGRAGSTDTQKVIWALEKHEYDNYKGKQWWVPWSHQSMQDNYILRSKSAKEKKDEWDLFEVVTAIKASENMDRTWQELGLKSNEPLSKLL